MKLWVDDLRPPPGTPNSDWGWAKTSAQAISCLKTWLKVEEMSLDHDLGGEDTTRAVVLFLCENDGPWPGKITVHSANPVGVEWLMGMCRRYAPQGTHLSVRTGSVPPTGANL